jgi:hypothetical protein
MDGVVRRPTGHPPATPNRTRSDHDGPASLAPARNYRSNPGGSAGGVGANVCNLGHRQATALVLVHRSCGLGPRVPAGVRRLPARARTDLNDAPRALRASRRLALLGNSRRADCELGSAAARVSERRRSLRARLGHRRIQVPAVAERRWQQQRDGFVPDSSPNSAYRSGSPQWACPKETRCALKVAMLGDPPDTRRCVRRSPRSPSCLR